MMYYCSPKIFTHLGNQGIVNYGRTKSSTVVDGESFEERITKIFRDMFSKVCTPNLIGKI